ncbi:MAG: ABC transporter ATP-binding protein, partial [Microbacterium gubbeenense]
MVTHHVEEIPVGFTHVMLVREGRAVAQGPLRETLTRENLAETFGFPIAVVEHRGRWVARAEAPIFA